MEVVVMWEASAPSNIALIKYMGKRNSLPVSGVTDVNVAVNPSLSWTLDHLRSFVQLELNSDPQFQRDEWSAHPQWPLEMSTIGREKFLAHLHRMKKSYSAENYHFKVRSGNNFPADCGIASSASSFAALTLAASQALSQLTQQPQLPLNQLADLSRQGSGSSCRSFFSGFVVWESEGVRALPTPTKLYHQVVIVSGDKKLVSSSQAHQRVQTSLLMKQREERVKLRFTQLCEQILNPELNWQQLFELSWAEFWDMHALFETSLPSFGYMTGKSLEILTAARVWWQNQGDGPLVTMDAGPNVHFLWRRDQIKMAQEFSRANSQWKWIEEER
jgi:diphosphomevalonate decarboxylase